MKKTLKITFIIFLVLAVLAALWFVLFIFTKKPVYEPGYQTAFTNPYNSVSLASEKAIEDIDTYIYDIKNNHPKPFAFISENELDRKVTAIKVEMAEKKEISTGELFLYLLEITGMIDDSHTAIHWPNFKKLYQLPIDINYTDDKFYNLRKDCIIPYKAEILAINSVESVELYNLLAQFSHTPLKSGTDRYVQSIFKTMIPLLIKTDQDYSVEYRINDEIKTEVIQLEEWSDKKTQRETVRFYEFESNKKTIPVLECNQFAGNFESFKTTVDDFFKRYGNSENIVIDIRNNGGGSDAWGYYVLDHFAGDKYTSFGDFQIPVNDYSRAFYTYNYQASLYDFKVPSVFWDVALNILPDLTFYREILGAEKGTLIKRGKIVRINRIVKTDRYKGNVFLLTGGNTGSAAIDFAAAFRFNKADGIILGQETNHPASYSGNATRYTLQNSKLNYRLPVTYCVDADGIDDGHGVLPDYYLNFGIEAYEEGKDPELEFLVATIDKL